jgi:hypothetical protein
VGRLCLASPTRGAGNQRGVIDLKDALLREDCGIALEKCKAWCWLKIDAEDWQQALHNCRKADESHKDLEQVSKPSVADKSIDQIKADCANNDDDQDVYEQHKHSLAPVLARRRFAIERMLGPAGRLRKRPAASTSTCFVA